MTTPKTPNSISDTKHWLRTAATISDALPYLRRHSGSTFVIKYGGHAMGDASLAETFARDIVLLKQVGINPVVVHGGGPQIGQMLERLKIASSFIDGLRVTDKATVEVVEMVLAGSINKQIVGAINAAGGTAIGICGKDGNLIRAEKLRRTKRDPDSNIERILDLGFVGEPTEINDKVITTIAQSDMIPVIAPVGVGPKGETFNINADTAAGAIAAAVQARRLLMLTDVPGVLDKEGNLIADMSVAEARRYMADGTITGGMIPKVETCIQAVEGSTEAAVILDGRVAHGMMLETFTHRGIGTLIHA
ncbi:acetylglutamate kinase [Tistrella bauzanensis]|uniref:Acetylglutamate kinase n=2 Tax=Tistrella TaxID=171436 RepID=A0ABU9YNC6_9PROT|nr:acetylglutamate kinase [Tistrella bauzanensis]GGB57028.1 acetylglutamate kinase [Tistrella bauzanensis]